MTLNPPSRIHPANAAGFPHGPIFKTCSCGADGAGESMPYREDRGADWNAIGKRVRAEVLRRIAGHFTKVSLSRASAVRESVIRGKGSPIHDADHWPAMDPVEGGSS